jgi:hypothetical protein
MAVTRHRVRVVLGALWILDGLLQLQRSMFTSGFGREVLAPAGVGQPWFVSEPVALTSRLVAEHPIPLDLGFAAIQLGLGIGFLVPRLVRPALIASIAWAFGVWWLGEGLGGLAGGHADLLTGAPGAVLLYALLAFAVWPRPGIDGSEHGPLPGVLALAWAGFWITGAVLRLLPGQASSHAIAGEISSSATGAPGWLQQLDQSVAAAVAPVGVAVVVGWVVVCVAVGVGGLRGGASRQAAASVGIVLATLFWIVGQSFGQPWTGMATDPNTSPLVVLMSVALIGIGAPAKARGRHRRAAQPASPRPVSSRAGSDTSVVPSSDFVTTTVNVWSAPELWRVRQAAAVGNWAPGPGSPEARGVVEPAEPEYASAGQ